MPLKRGCPKPVVSTLNAPMPHSQDPRMHAYKVLLDKARHSTLRGITFFEILGALVVIEMKSLIKPEQKGFCTEYHLKREYSPTCMISRVQRRQYGQCWDDEASDDTLDGTRSRRSSGGSSGGSSRGRGRGRGCGSLNSRDDLFDEAGGGNSKPPEQKHEPDPSVATGSAISPKVSTIPNFECSRTCCAGEGMPTNQDSLGPVGHGVDYAALVSPRLSSGGREQRRDTGGVNIVEGGSIHGECPGKGEEERHPHHALGYSRVPEQCLVDGLRDGAVEEEKGGTTWKRGGGGGERGGGKGGGAAVLTGEGGEGGGGGGGIEGRGGGKSKEGGGRGGKGGRRGGVWGQGRAHRDLPLRSSDMATRKTLSPPRRPDPGRDGLEATRVACSWEEEEEGEEEGGRGDHGRPVRWPTPRSVCASSGYMKYAVEAGDDPDGLRGTVAATAATARATRIRTRTRARTKTGIGRGTRTGPTTGIGTGASRGYSGEAAILLSGWRRSSSPDSTATTHAVVEDGGDKFCGESGGSGGGRGGSGYGCGGGVSDGLERLERDLRGAMVAVWLAWGVRIDAARAGRQRCQRRLEAGHRAQTAKVSAKRLFLSTLKGLSSFWSGLDSPGAVTEVAEEFV